MNLNHELSVSLPEICAPRNELLQVFDQCAKKQYINIQAPAGYGKTVSTLLWLKNSNCKFAWFTLDEYDNSPQLFYRSLCQRLLALASNNDAVSEILRNPAFSASPVESAIELLSFLNWPEERYALVLDDLHTIKNEEILKSLPFVLKRLPSQTNVFLLSRSALPEIMTLTKDKTAFIGSESLSFTSEEIQKHYAKHDRIITPEEAEKICVYTDGWVIILNAMVISGDSEFYDTNLQSSLIEFFEKNFWNNFDEYVQDFLMKTAVVDSFAVKLCEKLTEREDSEKVLETLILRNINLSRLGDEYRYHNLFLEFLRIKLMKSGIDQNKLIESTASYYSETSQFYKALVFSLRSKDRQLSSHVIGKFFSSKTPALEQFYELALLYDINQLTKERCDERPIFYMPNILAAFLRGDTVNTEKLFDMFYAALPKFFEYTHEIGDVAVTRLLLDYRIKLAQLPDLIDSLHLKIADKVSGQIAIITLQMPLLHRSIRDFTEFLNEETKEKVHDLFLCLLQNDCECFYQSVKAGLLIEQNRINEAFDLAFSAYNNLTETTSAEIYFGVSICLASIYLLKWETDKYSALLDGLYDFIAQNKVQYLLKNLSAYEERVKLWDGSKKAALEWLKNYYVSNNAFPELYKIYQSFTTARAYIVLGETSKAMAGLEQLKNLGQSMNRPLDAAEADILSAILEWATGQKQKACDRLYNALIILKPYGFIRIAANEGKAILPILTAIIKKMDKEPNKNETLYKFVKEVYVAAYEQSKHFKGLTHSLKLNPVKLSPRQTLVLKLLSEGHSNAEIVKLTGLSLNTIKTHTKLAYQKLGVTNSLDAIIEAKHLGIIK